MVIAIAIAIVSMKVSKRIIDSQDNKVNVLSQVKGL